MMLTSVSKKYRGKIEIIADMLSIANAPTGKTQMMQRANLSYLQLGSYLKELQENRLIETIAEDAATYRTTESGREFLNHFSRMSELLAKGFNLKEELL